MFEKTRTYFRPVILALMVVALGYACNDTTDDPEVSGNLVSVAGFSPSSACVDFDGEPVDEDGDGTADFTAFTSVVQDVLLDSRIRGDNPNSEFLDVIFSSVEIEYSISGGTAPPDRVDLITATVPAGGTATVGVTTVLAGDISGNFMGGTSGNATMTFKGEDASGEPVSAVGQTPIESANVCL